MPVGVKEREIMTIEQVAAFLQFNYFTVYRMVTAGKIPASKIGRSWRISKKDVLRYLERQKKKNDV